jgi:hypothetical protein
MAEKLKPGWILLFAPSSATILEGSIILSQVSIKCFSNSANHWLFNVRIKL